MRLPILVLHICAGVLGVLSGAAAMSFRKGSRRHRVAGNVFFVAMLVMGSSAAYLGNVVGGLFACYLVATDLWRMCFSFFIATGSFFLGQQQVFPKAWRGAVVWFVPALLPLAAMIFWLVRVRFTNAFRGKSVSSSGNFQSLPT